MGSASLSVDAARFARAVNPLASRATDPTDSAAPITETLPTSTTAMLKTDSIVSSQVERERRVSDLIWNGEIRNDPPEFPRRSYKEWADACSVADRD